MKNKHNWTVCGKLLPRGIWIKYGLICLLPLLLSSCFTPTPVPKAPKTATFDGNNYNSGIIAKAGDGSLIITQSARDRYNAFVERYGKSIGIQKDFGISQREDEYYYMTLEAAEKWKQMILISQRERVNEASR